MEVLDGTRDTMKLVKEFDNFELHRMILDLESEVMGVVKELGRLKKENASLKKQLEIK